MQQRLTGPWTARSILTSQDFLSGKMDAVHADDQRWTGNSGPHNARCHERWVQGRHRDTGKPGYLDRWYDEQCGGCRYWIALSGEIGRDYGACTNSASPFDGVVRFEHDGCDVFSPRPDGSFG
jgi:hypothetical protein